MKKILSESEVLDAAIALLARREYSRLELQIKLATKTENNALIEKALARVQELGYQCDRRYSECYIRYAVGQSKGPMWIVTKLRSKGVAAVLIDELLEAACPDWNALASDVLLRKFSTAAVDQKQQARQYRFLMSRGFSPDVVSAALSSLPKAIV